MSGSVRVVQVYDLEKFAESMTIFRNQWIETRQSLHSALIHTVDGPIQRRIPRSTRQRYPHRVDSGNQNLKKSYHIRVTKNQGTEIKVFLGSEGVEYARYVNDLPDPLPNGQRVKWSSTGTGNHFFLVPLEKHGDEIPKDFVKEVDTRLKRAGL